MKKLKLKRKRWLDRHSRVFDNSYVKHHASIEVWESERFHQSAKNREKLSYKTKKNKYKQLLAPEVFSLSQNPEGVLQFYDRIQSNIMRGNPVFFDMREIKTLTIDAIMYFLAILQDFKDSRLDCAFNGNLPNNVRCRELLTRSGFLTSVESRVKVNLKDSADNIKIIKGSMSDPSVAKQICKFTIEKLSVNRLQTRKLYDIISELMTNTRQWAYKQNGQSVCNWYIYAKYIKSEEVVRYTFLDTGKGIPSTIKKKCYESVSDTIGIIAHSKYIESALKGESRSSTGQKYRGEGLPRIYSYQQSGHIQNLTIISESGYYSGNRLYDINRKLKGSLFYWEFYKGDQNG